MSKSRKSRRKTPHRPSWRGGGGRWRLVVFGFAALAVVGVAVFMALSPLRAARTPAVATPGGPQVVVSMAGYSPARLSAKAGQDLTVTLVNPDSKFHTDGGGWHQFRAEGLDVDVKIPPSSQRTVTLRNLQAGTYEFYCDVCCGGKENPAMRGVLEVTG